MFIIEDERHSDQFGEYEDLDSALNELNRLSKLPWDQNPNKAPCQNWRNCGREFEIIEYNASTTPWTKLREIWPLTISSRGVEWHPIP